MTDFVSIPVTNDIGRDGVEELCEDLAVASRCVFEETNRTIRERVCNEAVLFRVKCVFVGDGRRTHVRCDFLPALGTHLWWDETEVL